MINQLQNTFLISNTIRKFEKKWEELKENIQFEDSTFAHNKWLSQIPIFKHLSYHNDVCICLWDIVLNRFLIAIDEKHITQYDMEDYTNTNGVNFSLANFHPEHLHAMQLINQCAR